MRFRPKDEGKLRVVCVSDTHGFENKLDALPLGDILLHCGDFARERNVREGTDLFVEWLKAQPHALKIVVRGNHDPMSLGSSFSLAPNILYATRSQIITIAGVPFGLAPYAQKNDHSKGMSSHSALPSSARVRLSTGSSSINNSDDDDAGVVTGKTAVCAVLASHVPPFGVLDECTQGGKHIGDPELRRKVESWVTKRAQPPPLPRRAAAAAAPRAAPKRTARMPRRESVIEEEEESGGGVGVGGYLAPSVWVCGHVHEASGSKLVDFSSSALNWPPSGSSKDSPRKLDTRKARKLRKIGGGISLVKATGTVNGTEPMRNSGCGSTRMPVSALKGRRAEFASLIQTVAAEQEATEVGQEGDGERSEYRGAEIVIERNCEDGDSGTASTDTKAQMVTQSPGVGVSTLCLNVAVANDGRATHIHKGRNGAAVFDICTATHSVDLLQLGGREDFYLETSRVG